MDYKTFAKKIMTLFLSISLVLNFIIVPVSASSSLNNVTQYTVLVLDNSGSMSGTPLEVMKSAAKKFCESLLENNSKNNIAIVTYASSARTIIEFSSDLTSLENAIDKITVTGGTNLNAGLSKAKSIFDQELIPNSVTKNIIIFSDGLPNEGTSATNGPYISSDYSYYYRANEVYNTAQLLKASYNIYTLGFFQKLNGSDLTFAKRFMNDLQNTAYYDVPNADSLEITFEKVAEDIVNPDNSTPSDYIPNNINEWSIESDQWKLDISGNSSFTTHKLPNSAYRSETIDFKFTITSKLHRQPQTTTSFPNEPLSLKKIKLFITAPENIKISNIGFNYPNGSVEGDPTTTYFELGDGLVPGSFVGTSRSYDLRFTFNPTQDAGSYDIKVRATADNADDLNTAFEIVYHKLDCPIIFIPGVMGSNLYKNADGRDRVWPPVESPAGLINFSHNIAYGNKLYPINNDINQVDLKKRNIGTDWTKGIREYGAQDTFKELIDSLCDKYANRGVFLFSYDFRQSNIESAKELEKLIDSLNVPKVDIICHSMGGIVLSNYVKANGTSKIGKTITIATPYEGAPKIINITLNPEIFSTRDDIADIVRLVDKNTEKDNKFKDNLLNFLGLDKKTKAGFPTSSELSPTIEYVNKTTLYQLQTVKKGLFSEDNYVPINYNEYSNICEEIYGVQNFANALQEQGSIKNSGINILTQFDNSYFIVGTLRPTISSLVFSEYYAGHYSELISNRSGEKVITTYDLVYEWKGDGTVPYASATMNGQLKNIKDADKRVFEIVADHTGIVMSNETINTVISILDNNPTANSTKTSSVSKPYIVLRIACPVDIEVTRGKEQLSSSMNNLNTLNSFGCLDFIGTNNEIKMLCIEDYNDYQIKLTGTGSGTMDYTIRWFDGNDNLIDERTFLNVEISPSTIINTGTDKTNPTTLSIDKNGDGNIDEEISANKNMIFDSKVDTQTPPPSQPNNVNTPPPTYTETTPILDPFVYEATFDESPVGTILGTDSSEEKLDKSIADAVIYAEDKTLKSGDKFVFMEDVTAKDDGGKGKDLSKRITLSGIINTKVPGKYFMYYSVKGANGQPVYKTITITVVE